MFDAVVVGSGPNGLTAAVALARAGLRVQVREAADVIGGGCKSRPLTLPGFVHDVCSAIHPLGVGSPYWKTLPLAEHGLEWVHPDAPLAHPLDDGPAVLLERSSAATGEHLDPVDRERWGKLVDPFVRRFDELLDDALGPMVHAPRRPFLLARFGLIAMQPADMLSKARFGGPRARALLAGIAAHAILPFDQPMSSAFGFMLALAGHAVGWPFPRGGAQKLSDALASLLRAHGGEIVTGAPVTSLAELDAKHVLFDTSPRAVLAIAGDAVSGSIRPRIEPWRYGPGVFKLDYALSGPIPWKDPAVARAATVHLGGRYEAIAASEREAWDGRTPSDPYVLLAQHTLFDASRAPAADSGAQGAGGHTCWAYGHVPNGSTDDATDLIEGQIERFAPGFRDRVLARSVLAPRDMEAQNPNLVGGDITGGANVLTQMVARPRVSLDPYRLGERVWLCSASSPPGGGVHGMCGWQAARSVLRSLGK